MRLLVTGGRDYQDQQLAFNALDKFHKEHEITLLIAGGAKGADSICQSWAKIKQIPHLIVPAQWVKHGRSAGAIRNSEMLKCKPDILMFFPGGRGTMDMKNKARKHGLILVEAEIYGEGDPRNAESS